MKERVKSILKFIRRERTLTKILSFTLCLVMVFYVIPSTIYTKAAELLENGDGAEAAPLTNIDSEQSEVETNNGVLFEDVSLREESAKHFHLEDGRYVAAQYNYPVHILDSNGEWQDIDNALVESGSEFTNSNARIKFAKKINGSSELFALHDGNTKLTLTLIGAVKGTVGEITNLADTESDTELQKMMNLEKLSASVIYRDILDGVDLEYVAYSMNVKENIIVKEKKESYSYSFELKLNGLTPTLTESGDIEIRSDDTDGLMYIIPAPVVFDSEGAYAPSDRAYYSLTHENGKKYTLTVTVDSVWMNAEERAFPVTVDPAVAKKGASVIDVNIDSANPNTQTNNVTALTVMDNGRTRIIHWKMTSLPTVPASARIIEASVGLCLQSGYGAYVGAYEVAKDWDSTLTWTKYKNTSNPQGTSLANLLDYKQLETSKYYYWNITESARKWYEDSSDNFGIAFASIPMNSTTATFYSNETANQPVLQIIYRDMKGLESYWPFSSHSAGIAGEGNINLANGNLVFTIPTLTTTDSIFSYTPYLTYDSSMANKAYYSGNANISLSSCSVATGFKLSINESIMLITLQGVNGAENYYVYSDADGTEHYFFSQSDGKYRDEDGLGLILTAEVNGDISVINDAKVKRYFKRIDDVNGNPSWILEYIEDISQNRLIFTYRAPHMLTNISLLPNGNTTAIVLLEFWYDQSTDALTMVYNSAAKTAVVFRYSDTYNSSVSTDAYSYLRQIDYAVGNANVAPSNWVDFIYSEANTQNITVYDTARYNYNSSGKITEVVNVKANTSVKYTWSGNYINKISEYAGTSLGNEVRFGFSNDYTYVYGNGNDGWLGTTDDIKNCYVMDSYGRCTDIYSTSKDGRTVYGAGNYSYDTQENSKNSIKQSATLGSQSVNYVMNGSFEDMNGASPSHWTLGGNASSTAINGVKGSFEKSVTLMPTENYGSSISQIMVLYYGTYTLSFPMHVTNGEGMSGSVTVRDYKTDALIYTEDISPIPHSGEGFFSTTFNIPRVDAHRYIELEISFTAPLDSDSVHTVELDSIMLAKTIGVESFNMVQFGGFEYTLVGSDGYQTTIPANYWADESGNAVSVGYLDTTTDRVATIRNTNGAEKYMKQTLYQATASKLAEYNAAEPYELDKQHHTLSVSGFANVNNTSSDRPAGLKVVIQYYRGTGISDIQDTYVFDFNTDNEEWQFTSGNVILGYTQDGALIDDYLGIRSITIYCDCSYSYGAAAAFNNISVTYAGIDSVTKYTYTEDGRIESVTDGSDGKFYLYNANGNVSKVADSRGNLVGYTYDAKNRVKAVLQSDYTYTGTGEYPYDSGDLFANMTVTNKYHTSYIYDNYGLLIYETSFAYNESGSANINEKYTESTYTYETSLTSKIFGALLSESHLPYSTNKYFYNADNGNLLASVSTGLGVGTTYSYDAAGRLLAVYPATYVSDTDTYTMVTGAENVEYTYNPQNRLSEISTESTTYTLLYDGFGNQSAIKAGNNTLATYEYGAFNGKLSQITYGNGHIVKYVYNDLEIVSEIWYNDDTEPTYEYQYTSDGKLTRLTDNINGTVTIYKYDGDGRLISGIDYDLTNSSVNASTKVQYNDESYVSNVEYVTPYYVGANLSSITSSHGYIYDHEGKITDEYIYVGEQTGEVFYGYDGHDRLITTNYYFDPVDSDSSYFSYTSDIVYLYLSSFTYPLVWEYTIDVEFESSNNSYYYGSTYNADGNLVSIVNWINDKTQYRWNYKYDDLSQLIREDNSQLGQTYVYEYDDAGNIISKKTYSYTMAAEITSTPLSVDTYVYSTSAWGDLLTSYNGTAITYDAIGNPLSYYNGSAYTFTWDGRRLATAVKGSKNMSFNYNDEGIRASKTVNGVTTHYVYSSNLLISEYTDTETIVYIYDVNGSPIGFRYRLNTYADDVWDTYWYVKNVQGDIVEIYSSAGVKLVTYKYDAWGNTTVAYSNNGANTTAVNNNLTYRGYYYDSDLGLYYLQTRYYDAKTSRFISPDTASILTATPAALTDKNLYAYCDNNPVMRVDEDGEFWLELGIMAAGGIIGAFTNGITSVISQYIINGDIDEESVAIAAASGFVSGAIAASPLGIVGQVIASGVIGGLSYVADAHANEEDVSEVGLAVAIGTGLVSGAIGGKGANHNQQLTIAITGVRNTKVFAPVMNSSREAASIIAKAIVRRDNIIGPAIKKFVICSSASIFVNEFAGKYFN